MHSVAQTINAIIVAPMTPLINSHLCRSLTDCSIELAGVVCVTASGANAVARVRAHHILFIRLWVVARRIAFEHPSLSYPSRFLSLHMMSLQWL